MIEPSAGELPGGPREDRELREQIERAKARSVVQLLFKAARLLKYELAPDATRADGGDVAAATRAVAPS